MPALGSSSGRVESGNETVETVPVLDCIVGPVAGVRFVLHSTALEWYNSGLK